MPISRETLDFLFENRLQDSQSWHEEHKKEYYKLVREPLLALAAEIGPALLDFDGQIVTDPAKCLSRIRRDTRFTHDKSLYRDHMWMEFRRSKNAFGWEMPCFWFSVESTGRFSCGCGFYWASTDYMDCLRRAVQNETPAWKAADAAVAKQSLFISDGERYKRPHYPDADPRKREWLELRGVDFSAESTDVNLLFSDKLGEKIASDLRTLGPVYRFLLEVAEEHRAAQLVRPWEMTD